MGTHTLEFRNADRSATPLTLCRTELPALPNFTGKRGHSPFLAQVVHVEL